MSKNKNENPRNINPLVIFASVLSAASIIWTTYSIADLFRLHSENPTAKLTDINNGAGWIGFTVAAGADIVWGGIIYAQYKGKPYRIGSDDKKFDLVPILGWIAVLAVVGLIGWHGYAQDNTAMMVGGPFLPLGAKIMWMLALNSMKDESRLTDDMEAEINDVIRQGSYTSQMNKAEENAAEAEHERSMAALRRKHEEEMAKLNFDAQKEREADRLRAERILAADENYFEITQIRNKQRRNMEIESPVITGELAMPEDISLRKPIGSIPSDHGTKRHNVINMPIDRLDHPDGLTEAQLRRRIIAGAWYLTEMNDSQITQREFCERTWVHGRKVTEPDLSKAKREFERAAFSDEELAEAYSQAVGS